MPTFFPAHPQGGYQSPLSAQTLAAPMFAPQRAALMRRFASESEMDAYLRDSESVARALRDYIWSLAPGGAASAERLSP
jgi:hypothetical protein